MKNPESSEEVVVVAAEAQEPVFRVDLPTRPQLQHTPHPHPCMSRQQLILHQAPVACLAVVPPGAPPPQLLPDACLVLPPDAIPAPPAIVACHAPVAIATLLQRRRHQHHHIQVVRQAMCPTRATHTTQAVSPPMCSGITAQSTVEKKAVMTTTSKRNAKGIQTGVRS